MPDVTFSRTIFRSLGRWTWLLVALLAAATGCKVGPNYMKPAVPLKAEWTQAGHPKFCGEPNDLCVWWNHFNDPQLNYLVHAAFDQNLTLRQAGMRIEEARAQRGIARGNFFPQTQQIFGTYSKSRTSPNNANIFLFPGSGVTLSPQNWSLGYTAAWELDFWGRFRRAIEAADANLDATVENYDDVLVVLIGDVANNYIQMRTLERRLVLARRNVDIQAGTLKLTQAKFEAGTISILDVAQAQSNLGQTEALIPTLEIQRRQACNRLCVLLGRPSIDLHPELGFTAHIPEPPECAVIGVPADLLRRRPDVRQAERILAQQSALIGVAVSDFYPHFSINGTINYSAQNFAQLIQSQSVAGQFLPQFRWNVLNYGRILNDVARQNAVFQQAAYNYQQAVVVADQEAEDAMIAYTRGFEQVAALDRAVKGAQTAVDKATEQYKAGVVDFNRVFLLQGDLVTQQDQLATAQGNVAISLVNTYRALGGGWELRLGADGEIIRLPPPPPPLPADVRDLFEPLPNPGPIQGNQEVLPPLKPKPLPMVEPLPMLDANGNPIPRVAPPANVPPPLPNP